VSELRVVAERAVGAPAEHAYRCIADFDRHHPRFLPPAFSQFRVEEGGVGAGTVHSFRMTAGGRTRSFRMRVEEPEPGDAWSALPALMSPNRVREEEQPSRSRVSHSRASNSSLQSTDVAPFLAVARPG
jgi:hypothetical protein